MTTRRRFIFMIPASGAVLAAACSDQATPPAAAPDAAPAAAPMAAPPPPAPVPAAPPAAPESSGSAPMLDEADPAAVALGYVADTARADKTKYPNHADSQSCATCGLYQGTAGADAGPCPLFAGKQVAAQGWCASYVKKPA